MSNDIPTDTTQVFEVPKVSLGQWLTQARQAKGLTVQEVALRTNRSVVQISELEADNLSSFGAQVLLRGMVRQYTKVVGADETQALRLIPEQFNTLNPLEGLGIKDSTISKKTARMGKPWISQIWIVLLTIVVLALLAYWVFGARMFKDKDAAQKMSTANQIQIANPPVPTTTAPAVVTPNPETTAASSVSVPPVTEQTPAPAATDATLGLNFKDVVWVEVKDAKGTVLVSGLQPANSEQNLKGELPLSVKIGDANKVEMTWKGQAYDLLSATKGRGTVAKIERLE